MLLKVIIAIISEISMCHSVYFFTYFISFSPHECLARRVFVKSSDRCRIREV